MVKNHPAPDILFCLTGDIDANSRALRQLDALVDAGMDVEAVGVAETARSEHRPGLRVIHYARPSGSGPAWFWKIHRLMRKHAQSVTARHFHASDLFVLPALTQRVSATKATLSFDSRELYPNVGATSGKPWASAVWAWIERRYIRRADTVFTVNDSIADILARKYGMPRPVVVANIPLKATPRDDGYLRKLTGARDDEVILLLQGHLKPGRGSELILEAMPHIERAHLVFLGEGPLRAKLEARSKALTLDDRVHFHDLVPPGHLLDTTASADLGICLIEPLTESLRLSLPNKLFEYLRAGIPVVASSLPEIERVVNGFRVGVCVPDLRPQAVATAISGAIENPDTIQHWRGNIPIVFETFNPRKASESFLNEILQLLQAR